MSKTQDLLFLNRCFQLAKKGLGTTYPNPMVGCVIVHQNTIIGEGFHHKAGKPHAEVLAIQSVKNKTLLPQSTLYVNLEPCNHFGKTPPCSNLIVSHQLKRVVIASKDSHQIVNGKGIAHLKDNHVEVDIITELSDKNHFLNRRFFHFHTEKKTYVILKWAQTENGFIDDISEIPLKISNKHSHQLSHKWRTEEQAILVGKNTVLKDNPKLNARNWKGEENYKIIIDRKLETPNEYKIFSQKKVIIFNEIKEEQIGNTFYKIVDYQEDIVPQILSVLYTLEIQSVIIEGGKITLQSFIDANLWNEARVFIAPFSITEGVKAPVLKSTIDATKQIENNRLNFYFNG